MRIAQISTVSAPVAEESSGSVESWVWLLSRELDRLGHEVTVFGTADSRLESRLEAILPAPYASSGSPDDWHLCEWINLCHAIGLSGSFDVMHSHAYLWGAPLAGASKAPMAHTTHIVPDANAAAIRKLYPHAAVTALSHTQWSAYPELAPSVVIPHGVDVTKFGLGTGSGDYLCYLGRFVSGKGPVQAIRIAQKLGVRLLMAGPGNAYFREHVAPKIDGKQVEYVGYVKGKDRDKLLREAKALLYPIQYAESFGLVLVESMLCGTPVAAMRLGAVSEIVEEGVTGFAADSEEGLAGAALKCFGLDRSQVRAVAERKFSAERMARDYATFYESILK